jgi:hypothetical protein
MLTDIFQTFDPAVPDFSAMEWEVSACEVTVMPPSTLLFETEVVSAFEPSLVLSSEVSLFLTTVLAYLAVLLD